MDQPDKEQWGCNKITAKFDTGAVRTVISLDTLVGKTFAKKYESVFINQCDALEFTSASGHKMYGVGSSFHNVRVSGIYLKEFYFHLLLGSNRSVALLGDDFILCCRFTHEPKQDILADIDVLCYQEEHRLAVDRDTDIFELLSKVLV